MSEIRIATVPLQGMSKWTNDINEKAGTTQELINARFYNQTLIPVQKRKQEYQMTYSKSRTIEDIETHVVYGDSGAIRYLWAIDRQNWKIIRWKKGDATATELFDIDTDNGESLLSITTLNNIVVVKTSWNSVYYIYKDGVYIKLPDMEWPDLLFYTKSEEDTTVVTGATYKELYGAIVKEIENQSKKNKWFGNAYLRFAFQLYDNTYTKHSPPIYTQLSPFIASFNNSTSPLEGYLDFFTLRFKFEHSLTSMFESYKGIIKNVSIFLSYIENPHEFPKDQDDFDSRDFPTSDGNIYEALYQDEKRLTDDIFQNTTNYYKIKEIPLDDFLQTTSSSWEIIDIPYSLTSQDPLTIDSYTHHVIAGKKAMNYNSRIHYANIVSHLSYNGNIYRRMINEWDDGDQYQVIEPTLSDFGTISENPYNNSGNNYDIYYEYEIKDINSNKIIQTKNPRHCVWNDSDGFPHLVFPPIISYPDSRATKLTVYLKNTDTGNTYKIDSFALKAHKLINVAYNITYLSGEDNKVPVYSRKYRLYANDTDFGANYTTVTLPTPTDRLLYDFNRIQLSELDNPFIYPAENSYQIGSMEDEIISIATTTEAISEGQFGMFPLYVFTKQGIWLMQQGSTGIQYSNIVPVSRVRALYESVAPTRAGIAFISKDGVQLVAGREVINISQQLRNIDNDFKVDSEDYNNLFDSDNYFSLYHIDNDTILDYLQDDSSATPFLAYNSYENELWVVNFNYLYSYVYNFNFQSWYKVDETFQYAFDNKPGTLLKQGDRAYNIEVADENNTERNIFIQTNPITFNTFWHKKVSHIMFRCTIKNSLYDPIHAYVFASNDLRTWYNINGLTTKKGQVTDLKIKRLRASYKYFIFILQAKPTVKESNTTAIQAQVEDKFDVKLR